MREKRLLQRIVANTAPLPPSAPSRRVERLIGRGAEGANTTVTIPDRETWKGLAVIVTYTATNNGNFLVHYSFKGSPALMMALTYDITGGDMVYCSFFIGSDGDTNNVPSGLATEALRAPLPDIALMGGDIITLGHQEAGAPGSAVFYYVILYERSLSE